VVLHSQRHYKLWRRKKYELGVSRPAASHTARFHINVAECVGEEESIKPLNRNRKTSEKEKRISCMGHQWLMKSDGPEQIWSPTQASSADLCIAADVINRTECLGGNGKEMIIVGDVSVLYVASIIRTCWRCTLSLSRTMYGIAPTTFSNKPLVNFYRLN